MSKKHTREKLALFMAASILLTVQETSAAGLLAPITALNDRTNLMLRTHGCHYSCECGSPREFGCEQQYHRHLHMLCLPVRCERRPDCERAPPVGDLAEEAEALADKVDRAEAQASLTPREVKTERS